MAKGIYEVFGEKREIEKYFIVHLPKGKRYWSCRRLRKQFMDQLGGKAYLNDCHFAETREVTELYFIPYRIKELWENDRIINKHPRAYYESVVEFIWGSPSGKPLIRSRVLFRIPKRVRTEHGRVVSLYGHQIKNHINVLRTVFETGVYEQAGRYHLDASYKAPDTIMKPYYLFGLIGDMINNVKKQIKGTLSTPEWA